MDLKEYLIESSRTESPYWYPDNIKVETLHGIIGVSGEAGELLDAAKKSLFYDQPLDKQNVREELGDILWYVAAIIRSEGWTFEDIMEENINKLRKRYPGKFTPELAKKRLDKI